MARATSPPLIRRLGRASQVVKAITRFLEDISSLLRQLVQVIGWIVLLIGIANIMLHPHLPTSHLLAPGAGALAILQSLIKPWQRHPEGTTILVGESSEQDDDLPSLETNESSEVELPPSRAAGL